MTELQKTRALLIEALEENVRLHNELVRAQIAEYERTHRLIALATAEYCRGLGEILTRQFFVA